LPPNHPSGVTVGELLKAALSEWCRREVLSSSFKVHEKFMREIPVIYEEIR
jgi:hypothetical protein